MTSFNWPKVAEWNHSNDEKFSIELNVAAWQQRQNYETECPGPPTEHGAARFPFYLIFGTTIRHNPSKVFESKHSNFVLFRHVCYPAPMLPCTAFLFQRGRDPYLIDFSHHEFIAHSSFPSAPPHDRLTNISQT